MNSSKVAIQRCSRHPNRSTRIGPARAQEEERSAHFEKKLEEKHRIILNASRIYKKARAMNNYGQIQKTPSCQPTPRQTGQVQSHGTSTPSCTALASVAWASARASRVSEPMCFSIPKIWAERHRRPSDRVQSDVSKDRCTTDVPNPFFFTTLKATSNKCHASSNRCLTSSNKKLLETSALLLVTIRI